MTQIYVNTNDPRRLAFSGQPSFYCKAFTVGGPLAARMLAAQQIADCVNATLATLDEVARPSEEAAKLMEELWHVIEETVRRFDGESAATKPPKKDSEALTSAPSDANSGQQESHSDTKYAASLSTSRLAARTRAAVARPR